MGAWLWSGIVVASVVVALPLFVYSVVWLIGRAFYGGKLSAIRAAFLGRMQNGEEEER